MPRRDVRLVPFVLLMSLVGVRSSEAGTMLLQSLSFGAAFSYTDGATADDNVPRLASGSGTQILGIAGFDSSLGVLNSVSVEMKSHVGFIFEGLHTDTTSGGCPFEGSITGIDCGQASLGNGTLTWNDTSWGALFATHGFGGHLFTSGNIARDTVRLVAGDRWDSFGWTSILDTTSDETVNDGLPDFGGTFTTLDRSVVYSGAAIPARFLSNGFFGSTLHFDFESNIDNCGWSPYGEEDTCDLQMVLYWTGTVDITYDYTPTPVPEPSTLALLGGGLFAVAASWKRRRSTERV